MPVALRIWCTGGSRASPSQGCQCPQSRAWGEGTKTLHSALWKHPWKSNECKCPHLSWPSCQCCGWLPREQSRLPFLQSPRLCNQLPKFSLLEFRKWGFLVSVGCLCTDVHMTKPTCELPSFALAPVIWSALAADWQQDACPWWHGESLEGPDRWTY